MSTVAPARGYTSAGAKAFRSGCNVSVYTFVYRVYGDVYVRVRDVYSCRLHATVYTYPDVMHLASSFTDVYVPVTHVY